MEIESEVDITALLTKLNINDKSNKILHVKNFCNKINGVCLCNKYGFYKKNIKSIIIIQRFFRNINYIKHKIIYKNFKTIMKNNIYIKNCKSNVKKDDDSLSSLIKRQLSQSDCIKLGTGVEKVFYDIIIQNTNFIDVKPKNSKGNKERDHLFCDEHNKIIYYAEFKSNINLDTEKSVSTYNKCLYIVKELQEKYVGYTIKWALVACRYINNKYIPEKLKNKYRCIENNLFGINDYLKLLKIYDDCFTIETYIDFLNEMADNMFTSYNS